MKTQKKPTAGDVLLTFRKIVTNVDRMERTLLELIEHPQAQDSMVLDAVHRYRVCAAGARDSARKTLEAARAPGRAGMVGWRLVENASLDFLRRHRRTTNG